MWNHPRGHVWNVFVRPASSCGATGRSGTPSRQSRGVDPPVQIRRGQRAQRGGRRKTSVFLSRETGISGNFVGRMGLFDLFVDGDPTPLPAYAQTIGDVFID